MRKASESKPPGAPLNLAKLVRTLLPEILTASTFQLSQQLLAWRVQEAFEADGVYLLQLTKDSELSLEAQAGPPPGERGFQSLQEAYEQGTPGGPQQLTWKDGDSHPKCLMHTTLKISGDHTVVFVVSKDEFVKEEVLGFKYLASVAAPVLGSALRQERVAAELIEARRLVQDTKAEQRAKSAFLARMSHDLRTPLSVVLGFAQLLEMEALSKKQQEHVQYILQSGRHLLSLINQVLELTDLDSGKLTLQLQPVQASAVVTKCVEAMLPNAREKQIKISIEEPTDGDHWVLADAARLEQILYNLLSNAIKFNKQDGAVTVAIGSASGRFVQIQVRDTGPGVPKAQIPRLFVPLDRLDARSEVEGSGLGLAVSQGLAQALGGSLRAESHIGRGSTFTVELPTAQKPRTKPVQE